ncbi:CDC42 guanine nucleotide exchange factor [Abortiporus biennis]
MSSAAARKKSIISTSVPVIDSPVANNTLLNKAASQSTSLYQQCSALRARLMRVQDFPEYFTLSSSPESSRRSTDPVTQLWDCFALGIPLCYLFNLLPQPISSIDIDTSNFDPTNDKMRKRAIALFAMGVRQIEGCGTFTVTDLWDRNSTDGFVKVVNIVSTVVDHLPEEVFIEDIPSSPPTEFSAKDSSDSLPTEFSAPTTGQDFPGSNVTKELLFTERKYVQDLEVMQQYSNALAQTNTIDQDTIHLLFPNLNKLLNFQRKFLIKLESVAEGSWSDSHWGSPFIDLEEEFAVYESYCANYTNASEIMLQEEHNLVALDHIMNAKSELPAFLIKPVQRVCKYPLLLESLIKALRDTDYPHMEELKAGLAATKRITDKVNEEQRRAENVATVKNLEGRVEDWKGHHISNFGNLLLDDIFTVTKSEMDREYHVFLFEKIILCCKEYIPNAANGKKVNKSNSILKKQGVPTPLNIPGGSGSSRKKNTPLLLKGRIFLNNVTSAVPKVIGSSYSLAVYWKGDDDLEYFTLRCRNEEQLRQWENQLNRLIQDVAARRTSDRNTHMKLAQIANSTSPAPSSRHTAPYGYTTNERTYSMFSNASTAHSAHGSTFPHQPHSSRSARYPDTRGDDHGFPTSASSGGGYGGGPQGYPPHTGFDVDPEDEFEDYPLASSLPSSGRGTPLGNRRQVPDMPGHPHPHMRSGAPPMPMSAGVSAFSPTMAPSRPSLSRTSGSHASDTSSFGPGVPPPRGALRSQFSSTKLRNAYERDVRASGPNPQTTPAFPTQSRSRSASQPTAYVPRQMPPPMPPTTWADRSQSSLGDSRRGSGSSQSTAPDSSDYSPHSSSPITPYGSSDSSLAGAMHGRQHHYEKIVNPAAEQLQIQVPVKVKVHFHEDIFVIQVPRTTEYEELVERVGKKIRLCGPRRDDGPLRVKYRDEDGDLVSLGSTEDVQMAFESFRPGSQVTLYVQ